MTTIGVGTIRQLEARENRGEEAGVARSKVPKIDWSRQAKFVQAEMDELERESHKHALEEEANEKKREQQHSDEPDNPTNTDTNNNTQQQSQSQTLQKEYDKVQEHLDNLKETKKEMGWLLKQVIKAETKRKAAESAIPKKKQKV